MKAYWFSDTDGYTPHMRQHGMTPAVVGQEHTFDGDLVPCESGLHASPTPWASLQYTDGTILWEVEVPDDSIPHGNPADKFCCRSRRYLRRADLTAVFRRFAAEQALSVAHLWDPPAVVMEYLMAAAAGQDRTDIRSLAGDAAYAVARDAAWAARDAAWAARAAAWAARVAAYAAAWAAAGAAGAARAAVWDAGAAGAAGAARDAASKRFGALALEALGGA